MPMSSKERTERFRERMRKDPERLTKYLTKEAERQRLKRAARTLEQREMDRMKTAERVRAYRDRQKKQTASTPLLRAYATAYTAAKEKASVHLNPQGTQYATTRALKRAITKCRNSLPSSPRKACEVVATLATSMGIPPKFPKLQAPVMVSALNQSIKEFYLRDDISMQTPGKRDYVTIRQNGEKIQVQKRYMLMTLREAHALFVEENGPTIKIGKSKFAELRPCHVLYMSNIPENVCLCQTHENINYLLSALSSDIASAFPRNHTELITALGCNTQDFQCMSPECTRCHKRWDELVAGISEEVRAKTFAYKKWEKNSDGQLVRVTNKTTVGKGVEEVEKMITKFLSHYFFQKQQSSSFHNLVKAASESAIVLQVDYSENYVIRHQDAIQADHWAGIPVTLYTAVAWLHESIRSFVLVSDYNAHDKYSTAVFNKHLLDKLIPLMSGECEVNIFSDGAAQHFKQRYTLAYLSLEERAKCFWNFFATSHGKGAVDGIGGAVKRAVHRHILARRCQPANAEQFAHCAQEAVPNISVQYISSSDIHASKQKLDEQWEDIRPISGIHGMHHVEILAPYLLKCAPVTNLRGDTTYSRIYSLREESVAGIPAMSPRLPTGTETDTDPLACATMESVRSHRVDEAYHKDCMESYSKQIMGQNLCVTGNTPSDGNCLYWAVSQQLDSICGEQQTHTYLRNLTARYIESLPHSDKDRISAFLTEPLDTYLSTLQKDASYADHIAVEMLAAALDCQICVYHSDPNNNVLVGKPGHVTKPLLLGYLPELKHYVALRECFISDKYYAVYYTDPPAFYLGRVTDSCCRCRALDRQHLRMLFLKRNYIRNSFCWAGKRAHECVPYVCAFAGPVALEGAGPFTVPLLKEIEAKFNELKKAF